MNQIILTPESSIFQTFSQIVYQQQMLFFAGLPGTGKSLLIKQLALLAQSHGRTVHLLQWDITRAAFETPDHLRRYPEIEGITHPAIRKAVGMWARGAVHRWSERYNGSSHFLLGEVPLIGNRLIELTQPLDDEIEPALTSEQTLFLIPVPSPAVRRYIETARETSIANPQHEKETKDAPPAVLHALWQDIVHINRQLNLTNSNVEPDTTYDPSVYTAVFQHLLRHRHHQVLPIDTILQPGSSAYDLQINGSELAATPSEVTAVMNQIEAEYTPESLATAVANWYKV